MLKIIDSDVEYILNVEKENAQNLVIPYIFKIL